MAEVKNSQKRNKNGKMKASEIQTDRYRIKNLCRGDFKKGIQYNYLLNWAMLPIMPND